MTLTKNDNRIHTNELTIEQLKEIAYYINNGVETKVGTRSYDIVDFYESYKIDYKFILKSLRAANTLTKEERILLSTFFNKEDKIANAEIGGKILENLINTKETINVERDEFGNFIPGSGIVIPKEERISWVTYLQDRSIEITNKTFVTMKKRYQNELNRNNNNAKKLTK